MKVFSLPPIYVTIIFAAFVFVAGCKKNDNPQPTPPPPSPPIVSPIVFNDEPVNTSVQGKITDPSGAAVKDALVKAGGQIITTDSNGYFFFSNIMLGKKAGTVSVEKQGYFKGSRTFSTIPDGINYVEIQLIPKTSAGSFSSTTGATISVGNSAAVKFNGGSIVDARGQVYSGTVNVMGVYLDPSDPVLQLIMPGGLMGLNNSNELKQLKTFGMMIIELEDAAGEKLGIAPGNTASLTMPIIPSMAAEAPDSIPLWYFNDDYGLWKQQGIARKQGSSYTGEVSHFTPWNIDVPANYITLKLNLVNQDGFPVWFYKVQPVNTEQNITSYTFSDSSGKVSIPVPPDLPFNLKVFNTCGTLVGSSNIGPFSTSTDIGRVKINDPESSRMIITGTIRNCDGQDITNAQLTIKSGYSYITNVKDGHFWISIFKCPETNTEIRVVMSDPASSGKLDTTITFATKAYTDIGILKTCTVPKDVYFNYRIAENNNSYFRFSSSLDTFTASRDSVSQNTMIMVRSSGSSPSHFANTRFQFNSPPSPDLYTVDLADFFQSGVLYEKKGAAVVGITEYGKAGEFIAGTLVSTFVNSTNPVDSINLIGDFRVKRVQ